MVELDYVRIKGDQYIIHEYTENPKHNIRAYMDTNGLQENTKYMIIEGLCGTHIEIKKKLSKLLY